MELDEPVVFYLKHRAQIEEWYQLRKRAADAANRFLATVATEIDDRTDSLGHDVFCVPILNSSYPKIFLCRAHWCDVDLERLRDKKDPKQLRVGIGLEWNRSKVQLVSDGSTDAPYSGVWFHRDHRGFGALEPQVRQAVGVPAGSKRGLWWPFFRYEPYAGPEVWNHLDEYKQQLTDRVVEIWQRYEAAVEDAIQAADASTAGSGSE